MSTTSINEGITIKGTRDGLQVTLGTAPLSSALTDLSARLAEKAGFFEGARVIVRSGERSLAVADLNALQVVLAQHNMTLWAVLSDAEDTRLAARQLGLATRLGTSVPVPPAEPAEASTVPAFLRTLRAEEAPAEAATPAEGAPAPAAVVEAPEAARALETPPPAPPAASDMPAAAAEASAEAPAAAAHAPTVPFMDEGVAGLYVRRTLRSGRSLRYQGAVIIYGDVNPGAEVIAGGDVIVWGKLRGLVHAGAMGDERAVVCALEMAPTQLRIAGCIAIAPEEKHRRRQSVPETARVQSGRIVVESWNPK